ncbi:MAG TPA: deoxyguanosinetriphosphate triphosphohydrolase [Clostridia bacterium]
MTIREEVESMEEKMLSKFAQLSINSKGRQYAEEKCSIRTDFQRDRDRIIYSKAFRRLKHKTQVFISPEGDHYRTRLTHTLEVSQIARTIARSLRLNEDLTEAISLGHDLGHTPFGHAGERVLNEVCPQGFKHNEQSLRVVEVLERNNGLNLTWEVRDGILNHTGENSASTLEGQIVKFADRIAYINHDIDDAIRGKVLSEESLPIECVLVLGNKSSKRIDVMIKDIVQNSRDSTKISMGPEIYEATNELRNFMFKNVYVDSIAKKEEKKAANILRELYVYLRDNQEILPEEMKTIVPKFGLDRIVCDYIAGMTDRYAVKKFSDIFIPTSWN